MVIKKPSKTSKTFKTNKLTIRGRQVGKSSLFKNFHQFVDHMEYQHNRNHENFNREYNCGYARSYALGHAENTIVDMQERRMENGLWRVLVRFSDGRHESIVVGESGAIGLRDYRRRNYHINQRAMYDGLYRLAHSSARSTTPPNVANDVLEYMYYRNNRPRSILLDELDFYYEDPKKTVVEYPKDLKCFACECSISHPQNIEQKLGAEETLKYINYCNEIKIKPQIYCCSCFSAVESNNGATRMFEKMVKTWKNFNDLHQKNLEMEKQLKQREEELDAQLAKKRSRKRK